MASVMSFDDLFARTPVMAILRGYSVDQTLEFANKAWDLGIECVEIPIQNEQALAALAATVEAGASRGKVVGAGTVVTTANVRQAKEVGAAFAVSPGLDQELVQSSFEAGLPMLPGVATASDIQLAQRLGLTWVKAFPAAELGTSWFRAMHGPFPQMKFVATGGITPADAPEFFEAGASVVSLGSALSDPGSWPTISALLRR